MSKALIPVVVVIVLLLVVGLAVFGQYVGVKNTLVSKNESVKAAWSQVDIVLQRRADLIPNLVETVKGYAAQEVTVFGDIAKARENLIMEEARKNNGMLGTAAEIGGGVLGSHTPRDARSRRVRTAICLQPTRARRVPMGGRFCP